jgi:hypothetical protein
VIQQTADRNTRADTFSADWERHERDGCWWAWWSWVQASGDRHVHKVVSVRAGLLAPVEAPDAYAGVPRQVRGTEGVIRELASARDRNTYDECMA